MKLDALLEKSYDSQETIQLPESYNTVNKSNSSSWEWSRVPLICHVKPAFQAYLPTANSVSPFYSLVKDYSLRPRRNTGFKGLERLRRHVGPRRTWVCCLQKLSRWRNLGRQHSLLTLDLDITECILASKDCHAAFFFFFLHFWGNERHK